MRAPEAGRGGHLAGAEEGAQGDGAADGRPDGVHLRARRGTGGGGRSEETARVSQTDRAGGQGNFRVAPRAGGRAGEGFAVANARWRSRRAPRGGPRFPSKPWRWPSSSVRGVRDVLLWRTPRRNQQKKKREPLVGRMCSAPPQWIVNIVGPVRVSFQVTRVRFRLLARRVSLVSLACSSSGLAFRCDPLPPPRPSSPS